MEEPGKKSKWDDLARELGANAPAESERPIAPAAAGDAAVTEPQVPKRDKAPANRPPARPKATAKDWDNLAAGLGIQPPPAPPTPVSPTRQQQGASVEVSKPAAPRPPRPRPVVEPETAEVASRASETEPPKSEESAVKPPAQGAGVSLWHKIFGSPDQQAQKIAEAGSDTEPARRPASDRPREERHDRHARHRDRPEDRRSDQEAEIVERGDSWTEEPAESAPGGAEEGVRPSAVEDAESRRGRPRRRRRGGRGRRSDGEGGEGRRPAADRGERRPDDRRKRSRPAARREDDAWADESVDDSADDDILEDVMADPDGDDDTELDSEEAGTESADRGSATGNRNIPSWDEAIGMIVDVNLQSRAERRHSSPQASRGPGPSRGGRPRRRRGGKKP